MLEIILNALSDITGLDTEELRENADVNLFEEGILDSLSLTSFVNTVARESGKTITFKNIDLEKFTTVNEINEQLSELD